MSSITRKTYSGPEDFPLLRAFLLRSGYSFDGGDDRLVQTQSADQLFTIIREGRHDPGQMLDALIAIRTIRLCGNNQRDLDRWENEGGSSTL